MNCHIDYCREHKPGDPAPRGYMEKHEWARVQLRAGLRQTRCGGCGKCLFPQEHKSHKCEPKETP